MHCVDLGSVLRNGTACGCTCWRYTIVVNREKMASVVPAPGPTYSTKTK